MQKRWGRGAWRTAQSEIEADLGMRDVREEGQRGKERDMVEKGNLCSHTFAEISLMFWALPSRADRRWMAWGCPGVGGPCPIACISTDLFSNTNLTPELQDYVLNCLGDIVSLIHCRYLKNKILEPVLATRCPHLKSWHHHHPSS